MLEVLASTNPLSELFLKTIYQQFLVEKQLANGDQPPIELLHNDGGGADIAEPLYLQKINDLKNVNALAAGQEIEFNRRLTIVFGENASGKTGYVRVLKQAAAARSIEIVLPDVVRVQGNKAKPSAVLSYIIGEEKRSMPWNNEAGVPPFTRVDVFDSRATNIHVDDDLKYVYTPSELARFPRVQKGVDWVKTTLESTIREASKAPNQFTAYFTARGTKVFALVELLGASTDISALEKLASVSDEERQRTATLRTDIDALRSSNPELQIKSLIALKQHIETLIRVASVLAAFNGEGYAELRNKVAKAKERLEEVSKTSFAGLSIPGILEHEWKQFITAGEDYLRTLPDSATYPIGGSSCAYCQQPLAQRAVELIRKYREYCNNSYRAEFDRLRNEQAPLSGPVVGVDFAKAKMALEQLLDGNRQLTNEEREVFVSVFNINGPGEALAIAEDRPLSWESRAKDTAQAILKLNSIKEKCEVGLTELTTRKEERERLLRNKEGEIAELEARAKLEQILPAIRDFVERAKWIDRAKIQMARFQGILRSLTEKAKVASTVLLNRDFEKLFQIECKALRVPAMALQFPGRDAQAVRKKIVAGDHKPSTILSEGEQKVTALADFLAEVTLKPPAPVVFDDPINSLDYIRINEVVDRLTSLSESRQVIVFTHNIWFATALLTKFEKRVGECSYFDVRRDDSNVESVDIVTKSTNPRSDSVKSLTASVNTCFERAAKEDPALKHIWIEKAYEYIRSLCEVIVEQELLAGATRRFEPNVRMTVLTNIKGRALKDAFGVIVPAFEDCCRYMSSHSQPLETLNIRPSLEKAKQDFKKVQDAREAYRKATE